jgi:aminopeptidase N
VRGILLRCGYLLIAVFLFCRDDLQGQDFEWKSQPDLPNSGIHAEAFETQTYPQPYDVLHYKLDASLGMVDGSFSGVMTITLLMKVNSPSSIWFHSLGLIFNSITVNDTVVGFSLDSPNERIRLEMPRIYPAGETLSVKLAYQRDILYPRLDSRQGYYWYAKRDSTVLENIGYTMSEPSDAKRWIPCYDDPSDKATCEIDIKVPAGYVAASNGTLTSIINLDSVVIFRWREDHPIATYLMCITASKYSTFSDYYHKVTNENDSLEVKYYVWQNDSAGTKYNAVQAFSKVTNMLRVYSTIFGEYPFEKYGMAAVYPFYFGGMEHQTMTSIHRSWLSVRGYPNNEDGIAHELSHEWWGDMVTCESFKDIWLNEGFASFAEALWREHEYGKSEYDRKMRNFLTFSSDWTHNIYDPVGQGQPLFGSAQYHKGAWVMHMLRYVLGDSIFFKSLENYRTAFGYSTASTQDLNTIVNMTSGGNYDWFFNQWIFGPGWPTYAISVAWNDSTSRYDLHLQQVQTSYPFFKMPIEIRVSSQGYDSVYVGWDSLSYQVFPLQAQVDSFRFDPFNHILKKVQSSVLISPAYELLQNYPNPFKASTRIVYTLPKSQPVVLKVFDVLGREIKTLVNKTQDIGSQTVILDAAGLSTGIYFYKLQTPERTLTRKMIHLK